MPIHAIRSHFITTGVRRVLAASGSGAWLGRRGVSVSRARGLTRWLHRTCSAALLGGVVVVSAAVSWGTLIASSAIWPRVTPRAAVPRYVRPAVRRDIRRGGRGCVCPGWVVSLCGPSARAAPRVLRVSRGVDTSRVCWWVVRVLLDGHAAAGSATVSRPWYSSHHGGVVPLFSRPVVVLRRCSRPYPPR